MKSPIDSRARFVETTAALLRRQGYHATGLNQIVKESGAPKGSLYFHFPGGKEALAQAALEHSGQGMHARLRALLDEASSPAEAVQGVADALADDLEASDFFDGCPAATVTLEAAARSPGLQQTCSTYYAGWQQLVEELLRGWTVPDEQVEPLANLILCALEGALLLSRAHADATPLRSVGQQLAAMLAQPARSTRRKGGKRR